MKNSITIRSSLGQQHGHLGFACRQAYDFGIRSFFYFPLALTHHALDALQLLAQLLLA
jgi:hypothetical protein